MYRVVASVAHSTRCVCRALHNSATRNAIQINMPSLSPTMETGTVVKWAVKPGDEIGPGDVLCEIQTDKAVVAMETDEEGTLAHILVEEGGAEVPVGAPIAVIAEAGEDWKSVEKPAAGAAAPPAKPKTEEIKEADTSKVPPSAKKAPEMPLEGRVSHILGPAAKLMMQEYAVKEDAVTHTGPFGVLMKADVLDYIRVHKLVKAPIKSEAAAAAAPVEPAKTAAPPAILGPTTDIPLTSMRKTIAKRLSFSKATIPHAYTSISTNMRCVEEMRKQMKADGIKVSMNDFIIKAVSAALLAVPSVNSTFENDVVMLQSGCDISVAVATPNGLITPIVRDVQLLDLPTISSIVAELAAKARDGKLQPHEFQGGNFTISNLGMFGISHFSAIINPPQTAILAVGGSSKYCTIDGPVTRMDVTLCFDNRAVSEFEAGRFLTFFRDVLESPERALIGKPMADNVDDLDALQGLL